MMLLTVLGGLAMLGSRALAAVPPTDSTCYSYCTSFVPMEEGADVRGVIKVYLTQTASWVEVFTHVLNDTLVSNDYSISTQLHPQKCSVLSQHNAGDGTLSDAYPPYTWDSGQEFRVVLGPHADKSRTRVFVDFPRLPPLSDSDLSFVIYNKDEQAHACCDMTRCAQPEVTACMAFASEWQVQSSAVRMSSVIGTAMLSATEDDRSAWFYDLQVHGVPADEVTDANPIDSLSEKDLMLSLHDAAYPDAPKTPVTIPNTRSPARIGQLVTDARPPAQLGTGRWSFVLLDSDNVTLAVADAQRCPASASSGPGAPMVDGLNDAPDAAVTQQPPHEGDGGSSSSKVTTYVAASLGVLAIGVVLLVVLYRDTLYSCIIGHKRSRADHASSNQPPVKDIPIEPERNHVELRLDLPIRATDGMFARRYETPEGSPETPRSSSADPGGFLAYDSLAQEPMNEVEYHPDYHDFNPYMMSNSSTFESYNPAYGAPPPLTRQMHSGRLRTTDSQKGNKIAPVPEHDILPPNHTTDSSSRLGNSDAHHAPLPPIPPNSLAFSGGGLAYWSPLHAAGNTVPLTSTSLSAGVVSSDGSLASTGRLTPYAQEAPRAPSMSAVSVPDRHGSYSSLPSSICLGPDSARRRGTETIHSNVQSNNTTAATTQTRTALTDTLGQVTTTSSGKCTPEHLLDYLNQLHLHGELFLGRYSVGPRKDCRPGGQGLVHFIKDSINEESLVVKFFESRVAFSRETALYGREDLRAMVPTLRLIEGNVSGDIQTSSGTVLPPFLIAERGEALDEWAARRQPDVSQSISVLMHITERLVQLHSLGIAHRDLKPGNILWRPQSNEWTLIDYGCAGNVSTSVPLSFTHRYAPPEVIRAYETGQRRIEARTEHDMWSLGVIAFELLTKARVFSSLQSKQDVMDQIMGRKPAPWEPKHPDYKTRSRYKVASAIKQHLKALLSREPSARPSAVEMLQAFHKLFSGTTTMVNSTTITSEGDGPSTDLQMSEREA